MSDGGKGSKQRPTDMNKFSANFDAIFGNKKRPPVVIGEPVPPMTQEKIDELNRVLDEYET